MIRNAIAGFLLIMLISAILQANVRLGFGMFTMLAYS